MPKVSIILPTYNYAHYLPAALESLLAQTYKNFEVIVVDDASSDNTKQVINKFLNQSDKIKYFKNRKNLGPAKNFNRGLSYASGQYVVFFHPDDLFAPQFLEKQVRILDANPNIGVVFCLSHTINSQGKIIGKQKSAYVKPVGLIPQPTAFSKLIFGNYLPFLSAITRRKLVERIGRLHPQLSQFCDWDLWLKISQLTDFYLLPEYLSYYRIHPQSHSYKIIKNLPQLYWEKEQIYHFIKQRCPKPYRLLLPFVFADVSISHLPSPGNFRGLQNFLAFAVDIFLSRLLRFIFWKK